MALALIILTCIRLDSYPRPLSRLARCKRVILPLPMRNGDMSSTEIYWCAGVRPVDVVVVQHVLKPLGLVPSQCVPTREDRIRESIEAFRRDGKAAQ